MKLSEIMDQESIYICDSCDKEFKARDVVLEDAADNIKILTPLAPFIYVDKDGVITAGSEQPSKEKGDKVLYCPHCKAVHLFGFSLK